MQFGGDATAAAAPPGAGAAARAPSPELIAAPAAGPAAGPGPGPVREAIMRCCISCGHRDCSTRANCMNCNVDMHRPCPSCAHIIHNGASMCLGCMNIDNAFVDQSKESSRADLAIQPYDADLLS